MAGEAEGDERDGDKTLVISKMRNATVGVSNSFLPFHAYPSMHTAVLPSHNQLGTMSGFEVAGLILGVVPLTIAALEQYRTAHEMLRYFNNKSLHIIRLIQALKEQKSCLESKFDIVLRASGFQQQNISTISEEYLQTIPLRNDVAEKLGQYLGCGYDPY